MSYISLKILLDHPFFYYSLFMIQIEIINRHILHKMFYKGVILALTVLLVSSKLVFEDNFDTLDFTKWRHDITLAGGGNW